MCFLRVARSRKPCLQKTQVTQLSYLGTKLVRTKFPSLVRSPGIKPAPPAVEALDMQRPNHWTIREVPTLHF